MQVSIRFSSQHVILTVVVHIASNVDFALICVYGNPHHRQMRVLWDQISNFMQDNQGKSVVCLGDVNDIKCDIDTTSINVNKYRMRSFCSYVKKCGLFDLGYNGPAYTWTNKCFSSSPIFERLDRCLANTDWCAIYPHTNVFNLPIMFGDHAPILVFT